MPHQACASHTKQIVLQMLQQLGASLENIRLAAERAMGMGFAT